MEGWSKGSLSPDTFDSVPVEFFVIADDPIKFFFQRLGQQHAIKRITMLPMKKSGTECVFSADGQDRELLAGQVRWQRSDESFSRGELAYFELDGNFPYAGGA